MNNGKVKCKICGKEFNQLTHTHMRKAHGITLDEYYERYYGATERNNQSRLDEFFKELSGWIMQDDNLQGIAKDVVNSILKDKQTKLNATILSVATLQLNRLGKLMGLVQEAEDELTQPHNIDQMRANPFYLMQVYKQASKEIKEVFKMLQDAQELEIKRTSAEHSSAGSGYNELDKPTNVQIFNTKLQQLNLDMPEKSGEREDIRRSVESLLNIMQKGVLDGSIEGSSDPDKLIDAGPETSEQTTTGTEESSPSSSEET